MAKIVPYSGPKPSNPKDFKEYEGETEAEWRAQGWRPPSHHDVYFQPRDPLTKEEQERIAAKMPKGDTVSFAPFTPDMALANPRPKTKNRRSTRHAGTGKGRNAVTRTKGGRTDGRRTAGKRKTVGRGRKRFRPRSHGDIKRRK